MKKNEHIDYWIESAENDLLAATNLFNAGNYSWCLFIGHLVLEKALKALYVKKFEDSVPPKIHNLTRLSEIIGVKPDFEIEIFLAAANKFHLEAR